MEKSNVHQLNDYAVSLTITRDYPRILALLESLEAALRRHQNYMGVSLVLQAAYDAQVLMRRQLKYYQQVKEKKGLIIE